MDGIIHAAAEDPFDLGHKVSGIGLHPVVDPVQEQGHQTERIQIEDKRLVLL